MILLPPHLGNIHRLFHGLELLTLNHRLDPLALLLSSLLWQGKCLCFLHRAIKSLSGLPPDPVEQWGPLGRWRFKHVNIARFTARRFWQSTNLGVWFKRETEVITIKSNFYIYGPSLNVQLKAICWTLGS